MNRLMGVIGLGLALSASAACGDDGDAGLSDAELVEQQIADGAVLYTDNCASCHGASGEGSTMAPAVVGAGVFPKDAPAGSVRDVQFVTALDVFVWASANMPAGNPGSIAQADMLAIFAFDLDANGVQLDKPLDADVAAAIVLNP